MKPISPIKRKEIYLKLLERFYEKEDLIVSGSEAQGMCNHLYILRFDRKLENYPELIKQKPHNADVFWFQYHLLDNSATRMVNFRKRVNIIENAIVKVNRKLVLKQISWKIRNFFTKIK